MLPMFGSNMVIKEDSVSMTLCINGGYAAVPELHLEKLHVHWH